MTKTDTSAFPGLIAELAGKFGISRPAGQCFAAIWRAAQAPCADDLVGGLGLSRSNISTALKELRGWGLIELQRAPGDRREFFTAPSDPWAVLRLLLAERARRDFAPLIDRLHMMEAAAPDARIAGLAHVLGDVSDWMVALSRLEPAELARHVGTPPETRESDTGKKKKKKSKKG
jgi:DNA-binding transcriptional regulator GbsR (MarR family)